MAAVIRIVVETSGGTEGTKRDILDLGRNAKESGDGFNALKEIATGALRAVGEGLVGLAVKGFGALHDAISDGIEDAKQTQILNAQTAAVIKSTGEAAGVTAEHVSDYASALSDAAGKSLFGDDQIQQSTNLLLTFTNIKGKALDAATAISVDMAQALGGAPKDSAIQLGKALNDPIKGITALTRVGVTFSEEQKAQIKAMQEAGDTAGAQGVILEELNKEFGGSAEAAAKATGGWSELNGRLGEAKEAIGAAILPLLSSLAGVLTDTVLPVIEAAGPIFGTLIQYFQAVVEDGDTLNDFLAGLPASWRPIIETIGNLVVTVQGLIASFSDTSPLDTFTAASTALGTFWSTTLAPALQTVWTVLQTQVWPILQDLATALFPLLNAAVQIAAGFWTNVLVPAIQMLWALLTTVVLPVLAALAGWLRDNLPGAIQVVTEFLVGTLFPALNRVYTFIQVNVIPILQVVAKWLIENVPIAIQAAADYWNNVLWPALQKIWAFIQDNLIPIIEDIAGRVFRALNDAVSEVARFWTNVLWPALNKVWEFINGSLIPLLTALANVAIALVKKEVELLAALWNNVLYPALQKVWDFIDKNIIPIFKTLVEVHIAAMKKAFNDLSSFFTNTVVPAMNKLYDIIYTYLAPALANLNSNVLEPMARWFGNISSAVSDLIGWLNDFQKKIDSIEVPSWVKGASPPPMAEWFSYIADSVKAVNAELPTFQANLAAPAGVGGQSIANTVSNRSFTYSPTINTSGGAAAPMDMALASSLAGV